MTAPDSMYAAAKKLAAAARLPWPLVQRVYRDLQVLGFLPKSTGRDIEHADPDAMASLIIALAVRHEARALHDIIVLFRLAGKDGAGFEGAWLCREMARLLTDAAAAADLDNIVFEIDTHRAVVNRSGQADAYFNEVDEVQADGSVRDATHDPAPLIKSRGVVSGELFRALQNTVVWKAAA